MVVDRGKMIIVQTNYRPNFRWGVAQSVLRQRVNKEVDDNVLSDRLNTLSSTEPKAQRMQHQIIGRMLQ